MKIGILRTGRALPKIKAKHGDFEDLFTILLAGNEMTFQPYAVLDGELPKSVTECDGWLITGSAHSSYEDLPWIADLEEFIRNAFTADIPIVGICFGHQILAQALGGKVEKYADGWAIGPHEYQFDGLAEPVTINAWHQDQVTQLPMGAKTVGRSEFCENAAIIYGKTAYSVQAHPEFTNAFIGDLIDIRRDSVPADLVNEAESALKSTTPSPVVVAQMVSFFQSRNLDTLPSNTAQRT